MAFQQGLSGLNASSKALDVISNNIANASTVGFKGGQAQFADVYSASLGVGGGSQVGIGTSMSGVQQQFSQGNISTSNNPLDLAINGAGFFRLQKSPTDQTTTYTRNGQFHLDASGYIINAQKANLTGYQVVNGVTDRSQLVPVKLDTSGVLPRATGSAALNPGITVQINLDDRHKQSLTSTGTDLLAPWSTNTKFPPDKMNTYNYSTPLTVYDQKGNDHALSIYFTRVGDASSPVPAKTQWQVHYVLDNQDITSTIVPAAAAAAGATTSLGVPTLEFNAAGGIVTTAAGWAGGVGLPITSTITAIGGLETSLPGMTSIVSAINAAGVDLSKPIAPATVAQVVIGPAPARLLDTSTVAVGTSLTVTYTTAATAMAPDAKFNINVANLNSFATNQAAIDAAIAAGTPPPVAVTPFNGLFDPTVAPNIPIDFNNSTALASGDDVNKLLQDGYPYGRLSGVSVSQSGVLRGNYSNGQTKDIAQLVLVDFIAPTGLSSMGNNQWGETGASGQALVGDPGAGNRGLLQSSSVEDANVDLTQELVNLITFQRNYQANAQSIKTQDQVMQTLVNLR